MYKSFILIILSVLTPLFGGVWASTGDRSKFFINCVQGCKANNCTNDGLDFRKPQPIVDVTDLCNHLLRWTCNDECLYSCMWRTTDAFLSRNWQTPQFFGKWPFIRILGMQEPASVIFSVLNFLTHLLMIKKFRRQVENDSPMYTIWHIFCAICLNAWFWSTVFHARDYQLTELFDYGFAYSIVLSSFGCMVLRMIHYRSSRLKGVLSVAILAFYMNHFAYLSLGTFDYKYNMLANIITGTISGLGWMIWYICQRKTKPYAWKMMTFQLLVAASLVLELNDFPPIWWMFDAHALWHLSTAPITILFYNFIIDDCNRLRWEKLEKIDKDKLL